MLKQCVLPSRKRGGGSNVKPHDGSPSRIDATSSRFRLAMKRPTSAPPSRTTSSRSPFLSSPAGVCSSAQPHRAPQSRPSTWLIRISPGSSRRMATVSCAPVSSTNNKRSPSSNITDSRCGWRSRYCSGMSISKPALSPGRPMALTSGRSSVASTVPTTASSMQRSNLRTGLASVLSIPQPEILPSPTFSTKPICSRVSKPRGLSIFAMAFDCLIQRDASRRTSLGLLTAPARARSVRRADYIPRQASASHARSAAPSPGPTSASTHA